MEGQVRGAKAYANGCISAVVVYGATENDIFYATELTNDLGSDFEANITKHLAP